jgi:carbonic anhydrase
MSTEQPASRMSAAGSGIGRTTGFELDSRDEPGADGIESALARNRAFAARGGHEGAVVFPNLRLYVITCLGPRTDPAHFLGLGLSDAMVLRNVGGRGSYAGRIGAEESTLREHAVLEPAATVTRDVERLRNAPALSPRVTVSGHVYDVLTGRVSTVIPACSSVRSTIEQTQSPPRPRDSGSAPTPTTTRPRDRRSAPTPTTTRPRDASLAPTPTTTPRELASGVSAATHIVKFTPEQRQHDPATCIPVGAHVRRGRRHRRGDRIRAISHPLTAR